MVTPDNGEQYLIELRSSAVTNIEGFQAEDADPTLTIDCADLEQTMMGVEPLTAQIEDDTATADGDLGVLQQLASTLVEFELGFEILPGTKGPAADAELNAFEVGPVGTQEE